MSHDLPPGHHATDILLPLCCRDANNSSARSRQQQAVQQQLLQRPPTVRKRLSGAATQRADLLQVAMASQQAQCVRLVVDALLEGRFSKVSVVLHMYEALQALIHDAQVSKLLGCCVSLVFSGLLVGHHCSSSSWWWMRC